MRENEWVPFSGFLNGKYNFFICKSHYEKSDPCECNITINLSPSENINKKICLNLRVYVLTFSIFFSYN